MATAKENILNRIKQALAQPVPLPFPAEDESAILYVKPEGSFAEMFAETFVSLQGNFIYCQRAGALPKMVLELLKLKDWNKVYCRQPDWVPFMREAGFPLTDDLAGCDVSITDCESLVARTGTVVLSAAQAEGRTASVYAPVHIFIAYTHQLVYDIKDALSAIEEKYKGNLPSLISFASGPSRTADIEKTLVTGVHGPKEVYCFLVEG